MTRRVRRVFNTRVLPSDTPRKWGGALTLRPRPPRMLPVPDSLSARLAPIVLPDCEGAQFRLGSLWAAAPAVVVFLRHYG